LENTYNQIQITKGFNIPIRKDIKIGYAPIAKCEIDGSITIDCLIDTGYPGFASIPASLTSELPQFRTGRFVTSSGSMTRGLIGSFDNSYLVRLDKIKIENLNLNSIPVIVEDRKDEMMQLGVSFLKHFQATIDFPNSVVYLQPHHSPLHIDKKYNSFGFSVDQNNGKTLVTGLWAGSPAEAGGIKIGDDLLEINSLNTKTLSLLKIMDLAQNNQILDILYSNNSGTQSRRIVLSKKDILGNLY